MPLTICRSLETKVIASLIILYFTCIFSLSMFLTQRAINFQDTICSKTKHQGNNEEFFQPASTVAAAKVRALFMRLIQNSINRFRNVETPLLFLVDSFSARDTSLRSLLITNFFFTCINEIRQIALLFRGFHQLAEIFNQIHFRYLVFRKNSTLILIYELKRKTLSCFVETACPEKVFVENCFFCYKI